MLSALSVRFLSCFIAVYLVGLVNGAFGFGDVGFSIYTIYPVVI